MELNVYDQIGLIIYIIAIAYFLIKGLIYKTRKDEMLVKFGFYKRKFVPSYQNIEGSTLLDAFKDLIRIIKAHHAELTRFNIEEESRANSILFSNKAEHLILEKQTKHFCITIFFILLFVKIFGSGEAGLYVDWTWIISLFFGYYLSAVFFNIKKYNVETYNRIDRLKGKHEDE